MCGDCYGTRKWWNFTLISRLSRGEIGANVLVTIDGFLRCGADLIWRLCPFAAEALLNNI